MDKEAQDRKDTPVYTGFMCYFPLAIEAVARLSKAGNDQHHPDEPLHWDKSKSIDHEDAGARHMLDKAKGIKFDTDGHRHSVKKAWRAMAELQIELENDEKERH